MKNSFFWIAVVGLGIWLLTKVKAGYSLQFVPRGISFDGANILIKLGVINSSQFPLTFNNFSGNLFLNQSPIGIVTDFQGQTISANGETDLILAFQPNVGVLITDIVNFIKDPTNTQSFNLQGSLTVENISMPVNQNLNLSL